MTKIISKIISIVQRRTLIVRSLAVQCLVRLSAVTVILLHGFLASGCDPIPPPNQTAPPARLTSYNDGWLETSAGVVNSAGDGWRLFVFGSGMGLSAKLTEFSNSPVATISYGLPPPAATNTGHWANDQLTVQLANGDLLLSWNGYSKIPDTNLEQNALWWNKWPTLDKKAPEQYGPPLTPREGVRPAQIFWRYSATNEQWTPSGVLDSAYAGGVDKNNAIQSDYYASGVPWVIGFDRPELYADPWGVNASDLSQQRLYLSTSCETVAFDKNGEVKFGADGKPVIDDSLEQVFISPDSGVTWQSSKFRLNRGVTAMTASSSGRLFMLQYGTNAKGVGVPVVYWSDDQGQTLSPDTPYESPVDVSYRKEDKNGALDLTKTFAASWLPSSTVGLGPPNVYPLSIAAVGPSAVIVVYPSQEDFYVDGDVNNEGFSKPHVRQVAVVTMLLAPKGGSPSVIPLAIIRAKSELGSVVMTGLITDNRAVPNPISLLYWMETTSTPSDPVVGVNSITCDWGPPIGVAVGYAIFSAQVPGTIGTLSDPAGFQRCPPKPPPVPFLPGWSFGDYMKGASYFDVQTETVNFVPVWSQEVASSDPTIHLVQPFARIVPVFVGAKQETQKSLDMNPEPAPAQGPAPRGRPGVRGVNQRTCDFCGERGDTRVRKP